MNSASSRSARAASMLADSTIADAICDRRVHNAQALALALKVRPCTRRKESRATRPRPTSRWSLRSAPIPPTWPERPIGSEQLPKPAGNTHAHAERERPAPSSSTPPVKAATGPAQGRDQLPLGLVHAPHPGVRPACAGEDLLDRLEPQRAQQLGRVLDLVSYSTTAETR